MSPHIKQLVSFLLTISFSLGMEASAFALQPTTPPKQYVIMDDLKDFIASPTSLFKKYSFWMWTIPTLLLYANDKSLTEFYQTNVDAPLRQNFHSVYGPFRMDHYIFWGLSTLFVLNDYYKDAKWKQLAYLGGEAMIDSLFVAQSLKHIIGRARPTANEGPLNWGRFDTDIFGPYTSMPSSHATFYFAFSAILGKVYGNEWLGDLTGLTYFFMEINHNHWMSDIWVGYLLGKAIGNYVWNKRSETLSSRPYDAWWIYPTFRSTAQSGFPMISFWKIF